jgi:hypothetical protein
MKPAGLVAWSKTAAVRPAICYYGLMAGDNALVALATYRRGGATLANAKSPSGIRRLA